MTLRRPNQQMKQSTDGGDNLFAGGSTGMPGTPQNPNTGVAGGGAPQGSQILAPAPNPQLPPVPIVGSGDPNKAGVPDVQKRTSSTTLMEGNTDKLGSAAHIAKSPKYQFLSKATEYGRGQEGDLLNRLKSEHGDHWNGWDFDGKGNFRHDGKTPLHAAWGGITNVDAYGGYQSGGDLKARWGAGEKDAGPSGPMAKMGGGPMTHMTQAGPDVARRSASQADPNANPFASHPSGGVRLANGNWVPGDHPEAQGAKWAGGGGPAATPGTTPNPTPGGEEQVQPPGSQPAGPESTGSRKAIDDLIAKMMSGEHNKDVVNRRVDGARDVLNKQRKSSVDTLGASLAERGQLGSGADGEAHNRLDQALGDEFAGEVNQIFANESENADDRLGKGLAAGTSLSIADQENSLGRDRLGHEKDRDGKRLDLDRHLGDADIDVRRRTIAETARNNDMTNSTNNRRISSDEAIGNRRIDVDSQLGNRGYDVAGVGQQNDWNKFLGQLGLDRDKLGADMDKNDMDAILEILRLKGNAGKTSADGYY